MNNMLLDHQVMKAAAEAGVKKFIYASTACVYPTNLQADEKSRSLLQETDASFEIPGKAFADGEYGWAKLMGEMQLRAFYKQYQMPSVACRIFTAYGERENESHAVIALIAKGLAKLDPYPIWGNGLQTRNFTYVQDTVYGMALACAKMSGCEVINIGSSRHHTVLELIQEIFNTLNWEPKDILKELDKPVGVLSRASNNEKSSSLLNWEATFPLAEGVRRTVLWYQGQKSPEDRVELERRLIERS